MNNHQVHHLRGQQSQVHVGCKCRLGGGSHRWCAGGKISHLDCHVPILLRSHTISHILLFYALKIKSIKTYINCNKTKPVQEWPTTTNIFYLGSSQVTTYIQRVRT